MCGVFGFIADGRSDKGPNIKALKRMAVTTEARGRHAFGIAWLDQAGRLHAIKKPGKITDHLNLLDQCRGARVVVGHCRYATQGNPKNNANNHPHPADGGWLVHNGTVTNYKAIKSDREIDTMTECDSEILCRLIERSTKKSLLARLVDATNTTAANDDVGLLGVWKPGRLVMVKRGKPMQVSKTRSGTYVASLTEGLPGNPKRVNNYTAVEWTWREGEAPKRREMQVPKPKERNHEGEWDRNVSDGSDGKGKGRVVTRPKRNGGGACGGSIWMNAGRPTPVSDRREPRPLVTPQGGGRPLGKAKRRRPKLSNETMLQLQERMATDGRDMMTFDDADWYADQRARELVRLGVSGDNLQETLVRELLELF